jgi:hypothetical protein
MYIIPAFSLNMLDMFIIFLEFFVLASINYMNKLYNFKARLRLFSDFCSNCNQMRH